MRTLNCQICSIWSIFHVYNYQYRFLGRKSVFFRFFVQLSIVLSCLTEFNVKRFSIVRNRIELKVIKKTENPQLFKSHILWTRIYCWPQLSCHCQLDDQMIGFPVTVRNVRWILSFRFPLTSYNQTTPHSSTVRRVKERT